MALLSRALSYPGILTDQPPSQRTRSRNPEPGPSSGVGGGACWLPSDEGGCLSGGGSASFMPSSPLPSDSRAAQKAHQELFSLRGWVYTQDPSVPLRGMAQPLALYLQG